jgi:hypothetical protein
MLKKKLLLYKKSSQLDANKNNFSYEIYKDLLSAVDEHGYQISPIMEVDQTFATDLIRARSEAEAEFIYHLIRRELNP